MKYTRIGCIRGRVDRRSAKRVYGCVGKIELAIEPPKNMMWIMAS